MDKESKTLIEALSSALKPFAMASAPDPYRDERERERISLDRLGRKADAIRIADKSEIPFLVEVETTGSTVLCGHVLDGAGKHEVSLWFHQYDDALKAARTPEEAERAKRAEAVFAKASLKDRATSVPRHYQIAAVADHDDSVRKDLPCVVGVRKL